MLIEEFYTAPNTPAFVHDLSYTFLDLYDWLEMINTSLDPYQEPVTAEDLDLVFSRGGAIGCTTARRF